MKLISSFHTSEAAHELRQRLERAGIAVIVHAPPRIRGNSSPTHLVFAAIDAQHGDAMALLGNPQHRVERRVDLDVFAAHMGDSAREYAVRQAMTRGLLWILLVLVAAAIAAILLIAR